MIRFVILAATIVVTVSRYYGGGELVEEQKINASEAWGREAAQVCRTSYMYRWMCCAFPCAKTSDYKACEKAYMEMNSHE
jgi:hypothetical protein